MDSLRRINASYTASLLEEAIRVVEDPNIQAAADDENTDIQSERLNVLDDKFYEYKEDLLELQLNFIKEHKDNFIG